MSKTKLRDVLPPGAWIFVGKLPHSATAEQVADYFASNGVPLAPHEVYVRQGPHTAFAFISVSTETVLSLVSWAVNGAPFTEDGEAPILRMPDYYKSDRPQARNRV